MVHRTPYARSTLRLLALDKTVSALSCYITGTTLAGLANKW